MGWVDSVVGAVVASWLTLGAVTEVAAGKKKKKKIEAIFDCELESVREAGLCD